MKIESAIRDVGLIDALSSGDTFVHRLDPTAKIITTAVYVVAVVSFPKYELSALLPFLLYPVWLAGMGGVPFGYVARKLIAVSPFALMVAIWNPFLDRKIILTLWETGISGGTISFLSIMTRFVLTVGAAFILLAVTGFNNLAFGLKKLGMPRVMTVQLLFLYRYIFVLGEEALRTARARALRSFGGRGMGVKVFSHIVGNLMLRTLDRARRLYLAMLARGFDGEIRVTRPMRLGTNELAFVLVWSALFILLRLVNLSELAGLIITGTKT